MKSRWKILIIITGVIGIALVAGIVIFNRTHQAVKTQTINGVDQHPNFQTVTPKNSKDDSLKNATLRDTPNDGQVFTFTDTIDTVSISVNQQRLPDNSTIADIAKNLNATHKVSANGLDLYIGTSEQGPQTAVFSKKDLLILIKSASTVKDSSWIAYAQSMN